MTLDCICFFFLTPYNIYYIVAIMKVKKVKSFTVDGDVYASLVAHLKDAKSGLSVSTIDDDYLVYLLNEDCGLHHIWRRGGQGFLLLLLVATSFKEPFNRAIKRLRKTEKTA